ncbi:MAG: 3-oxoacyl-ACP reductase FabG [Candidatus Aenigmarchaeota archaeon]|nr:3-oxoacyl-ACP reductase FabG [Candidatus Aenigmarchaeota archaeon]
MFELNGKKALVTGAARGIGKAIALALAKQGADVCVNDVIEGENVVKEIKSTGRDAFFFHADVSKSSEVSKMFNEARKRWGKLDILVNNAGILRSSPFESISEEEWDNVIGINLKGQFLCSREAVRLMPRGARIINIASIASGGSGIGFLGIAHYTASKGAIVALTENMAVDLAAKGINVNAIAPGAVDTDMTKGMLDDDKSRKAFLSRIPKGRIGRPEDIAAVAVFLASQEADYVNGTVIYADGGWLAS